MFTCGIEQASVGTDLGTPSSDVVFELGNRRRLIRVHLVFQEVPKEKIKRCYVTHFCEIKFSSQPVDTPATLKAAG